jgi:hypothetical protein
MYKGQAINGGLAALLDLGDSFTLGVLMEANKEEFSLDNIGASGEALTLAPGLELLLRSGRLNGALMFQYLHTGRTFDYKGDRFKSAVNGMRIATDGSVNVLELGHFGVALPFRGVVNLSNNNGNGTPNKNSYASRIMSGVLGTAHYKGVNAAFGPTLQWNRQYSKYNNTAGNSLNLGGFARFSLGSISLEGEFSDTVAGKNNYRRQGGAGRVVVPVWGLYVIPEFAGVREEIGGPLSTRNTSLMFSIGLTSRRPGDENALPRDVITYER